MLSRGLGTRETKCLFPEHFHTIQTDLIIKSKTPKILFSLADLGLLLERGEKERYIVSRTVRAEF